MLLCPQSNDSRHRYSIINELNTTDYVFAEATDVYIQGLSETVKRTKNAYGHVAATERMAKWQKRFHSESERLLKREAEKKVIELRII